MKRIAVVALLVSSTTSACGDAPAPKSVAYRLSTHCGIHYTRFDGKWYYADPQNPPGTWSNPFDVGTMTRVDKQTIVFTDPAGNRAVFVTHPTSAVPTLQGCD